MCLWCWLFLFAQSTLHLHPCVCWLFPGGLIGAVVTSARLRFFWQQILHTLFHKNEPLQNKFLHPAWLKTSKVPLRCDGQMRRHRRVLPSLAFETSGSNCMLAWNSYRFKPFHVHYLANYSCCGVMLWDHGGISMDFSIIDDLWRWPLRWNNMLSVEANLACRDLKWNQCFVIFLSL